MSSPLAGLLTHPVLPPSAPTVRLCVCACMVPMLYGAVCMQAAVGGRMRLFISGGAPLPTYAGNFMATAMNVPVLQVRELADDLPGTVVMTAIGLMWHMP